ncbi:DdpA ABC-type dipeptide transport system, periplasmic component [Rhabdaerophilaceae bacterium]
MTSLMQSCRAMAGAGLLHIAMLVLPNASVASDRVTALEVPLFRADVASGKLPPVSERLPQAPRVVPLQSMGRENGVHGGVVRMLMGDQRDIRMATIYGYSRLVGFDLDGRLQPDLLLKVDIEEGRRFTLHLRPGHRWSDGHPFTAEDFRYWWDDVGNNKRLSQSGLPQALLSADGKAPVFEVIDPLTVRYTWEKPNPLFLPSLAGAQAQTLAMPAHYMKLFHEKYADKAKLASEIQRIKVRDWGALHERRSRAYRPENPELPSLDPWVNRTSPPAERFIFTRNPYYHRVDENGRQLPYLDEIQMSITSPALIPAKTAAGESDLQARYVRFDNYTFLRESARRQRYRVLLWDQGMGAQVSLKPNLNASDPVLRALFRDVRVRRALSLGINRKDINQVIFFGLGHEAANSVLPGSVFYHDADAKAWASYDVKQANALLDAAGLTKRDVSGYRLLPDGRQVFLTAETSGESTEETDVLQLVGQDWAKLGIRLFVRATQRDVFRRRAIAGHNQISVWQGMDNGTPGPDNEPEALAPTSSSQFEWPLWGQYQATGGKEGEAPADPAVLELIRLHTAWRGSASDEERHAIWRKMLAINADQVFTIGIVNRTKQPIVVSERLRNVPEHGVLSFEPRAFLGAYLPDTFFYADQKGQ